LLRNGTFWPENITRPGSQGAVGRSNVTPVSPVTIDPPGAGNARSRAALLFIGARRVARDGDLTVPAGPSAPIDGVMDTGTKPVILDGVDPQAVDTRSDEDRNAFDAPPAGYDPLLFQIEEIAPASPSLNRAPTRLFTREPYDPIGVRIGSFVLFPQSESGISWSSNVFASPNGETDISYVTRPSARLVSNWRSHAIELRATGELSSFDTFKTEDARGYLLEARGRLDVTRFTNVQGLISRQLSQESRSAVNALSVGDRADILVYNAALSFNHRFNRLSVQLRGAISNFDYGSVTVPGSQGGGGNAGIQGTISNDDRDYLETRQAVRASWEFKPTFRVFTEAEFIQRDYDVAPISDSILRDSQGGRYRVGFDFGATSDIMRGEISLGYGDHRPDDERLSSIDGLIVDANLAWRANGLTTLLLSGRSDVSETTTAFSSGVFERQVGVNVRHAFRRDLIGLAGISYLTRNYAGIDIDEHDVLFSLGSEYFLNRGIVLFGNYGHTISRSEFAQSNYDLDEIHIGVRVRR